MLTLSASPQPGTDYIYTTAYYAKGSKWLPTTLTGNNAAPSYSSGPASGSLSASILSTLTPGTNYLVLWDWLWDATAGCYKGPGLNQCNTGTWRVQEFNLTSGTQGPVSISPTTLTFPSTAVGTTSPTQYATLTNTASVTLNFIGNYSITGDFAFAGTGTCVGSVAPGASCTFSVKFTPTVAGTRTGQVSIIDDAPGSPHTFNLSGVGGTSGYTYSQSTYTSGCTSNCFYISPSGSDSNSGTSAGAPWKTFAHAIPLLNPGYTLLLENGTYQPGTGTGFPNINCSGAAHNGTSGNPVTIQSLNERQALIKGDGSTEPFQMFNCSYWNIVGLDIQDGDWPRGENNATVDLENSSHLVFRRNILAHSNRCHNLNLMQVGPNTTNSLFEENEFYYFHRHAMYFWSNANNNESRRNYANSRTYGGPFTCTSGTYDPQGDATAGFNYGSHFNIVENVIGENTPGGFGDEPIGTAPALCSNSVGDNQWLGNIALNNRYGYTSHPHSSGAVCVPNNLTFKNFVVINPHSVGTYLRSSTNVSITNFSEFGSGSSGNLIQDHAPENLNTPASTITNSEIVSTFSPGYNIVNGTAALDHIGNFGGTISNATVTNPFTQNPAFGSCYLWVPASSPLKGAGSGGSDIGANILYAYQGGTLTNSKLWNTDGSFVGKGAIVPGLSDVAGSSLFDIQNRLNINKNGCVFPAGY